ncbi:hypothetical protein LOD99_4010 [Oopsacas minuta]|uniref:Uncharacterized protein n=1 Tax=Oopsacas minuta TaxID=111878 RepID=A0AAV7JV85_9METZ|nr:hypothetical protein LOD99_4010 [Oopsacas minuta]
MAEPTILSENQKTRLHLAIILKAHNYDIYHAADEVMRLLNLEEDKRHSVYSPMSKISFCLRKSKKSIESVDGVVECKEEKSIDDIQVGSKKIRLDQNGILTYFRQLAQLENNSVLRYIALPLYIVAVEQIGFKGIANIAWKIYNEESIPTLSNIASPEKSAFLAHQLKMEKENGEILNIISNKASFWQLGKNLQN